MYTRTPKIACGATNRKVFPGTNWSPSESRFFHMFLSPVYPCIPLQVQTQSLQRLGSPLGCFRLLTFTIEQINETLYYIVQICVVPCYGGSCFQNLHPTTQG